MDATIQCLSPVLGSAGVVAIVDLGLVVLVTVVLVTVVLSDVAAGFTAGSVSGPAPGCPAEGPAPAAQTDRPGKAPEQSRPCAANTVARYGDLLYRR